MTKEQYKKYREISNEIASVERFLYWCGDRYKDCSGAYPFSIKTIGKKFFLYMKRWFSSEEENTIKLPLDLQKRIVEVVEQYIDEKKKELEEI